MQQAGSVESVMSLTPDIAYTTSFYDCVKLCFAKGGLQLDNSDSAAAHSATKVQSEFKAPNGDH